MSLTFHQFRRDFRQFRGLLAMWLVLLALDLGLGLEVVGVRIEDWAQRGGLAMQMASTWMVVLEWALLFLLPAWVVLSDSPTRRDGFLGTRPMPRRDLLLAKAFFIGLLVVMPLLLQEELHLLLAGWSVGQIAHGTFERLLFVLPAAVFAAAFAALWPNVAQWGVATAATVGGGWLAAVAFIVTGEWLGGAFSGINDPTTTSVLVSSYLAAGGTVGLAVLNHCRRWGVLWRGVGLGAVGLLVLATLGLWRGEWFSVVPEEPARVAQLAEAAAVVVPLPGIKVDFPVRSRAPGGPKLAVTVEARLDPWPAGQVLRWQCRQAGVAMADGAQLPLECRSRPLDLWNANPGLEDLQAWSGLLPSGTVIHAGGLPRIAHALVPLGEGDREALLARAGRAATLRALLRGAAQGWEVAAELPLREDAAVFDATGEWRTTRVNRQTSRPDQVRVALVRDQVRFFTARRAEVSRAVPWPYGAHAIVLYLPERGLALAPNHLSWPRQWPQMLTASARFFLELEFGGESGQELGLGPEAYHGARLVIFRRRYLGPVEREWASPPLFLEGSQPERAPEAALPETLLSAIEFRLRLRELRQPGSEAGRLEVGRYLAEVVRLLETRQGVGRQDEPVVRDLAVLVPRHLELVMEAAALSHRGRSVLEGAIILGAEEGQRGQVIARLVSQPELAGVLITRGWVEEARGALRELTRRPGMLPFEALQAIALLEAPETYPRLLAQLQERPSLDLYELARVLPGIEPALSEAVTDVWTRRVSGMEVGPGTASALEVVMRHGNREALELAYDCFLNLAEEARARSWYLLEVFSRNLRWEGMKPEDLHDHRRQAEWLAAHRAEDFRFDPVRRRFVLAEEPRAARREAGIAAGMMGRSR